MGLRVESTLLCDILYTCPRRKHSQVTLDKHSYHHFHVQWHMSFQLGRPQGSHYSLSLLTVPSQLALHFLPDSLTHCTLWVLSS